MNNKNELIKYIRKYIKHVKLKYNKIINEIDITFNNKELEYSTIHELNCIKKVIDLFLQKKHRELYFRFQICEIYKQEIHKYYEERDINWIDKVLMDFNEDKYTISEVWDYDFSLIAFIIAAEKESRLNCFYILEKYRNKGNGKSLINHINDLFFEDSIYYTLYINKELLELREFLLKNNYEIINEDDKYIYFNFDLLKYRKENIY